MQRTLRKNSFIVFWVIALLGSIASGFQLIWADYFLKPLLMPVLMAALFLRTTNTKGRTKIYLALFFSFCGDIMLLFETGNPLNFTIGLVFFLIAHLFYIAYFIQIKQPGPSAAKKYPFLVFLVAAYTTSLLLLLLPKLEDLKIPVSIYAVIISTMFYLSLCIPYKIGKIAGQLFITGACFFILSDSLLAINKFYFSFTAAPVLIRLTYCAAQYYIVKGFIKKRY